MGDRGQRCLLPTDRLLIHRRAPSIAAPCLLARLGAVGQIIGAAIEQDHAPISKIDRGVGGVHFINAVQSGRKFLDRQLQTVATRVRQSVAIIAKWHAKNGSASPGVKKRGSSGRNSTLTGIAIIRSIAPKIFHAHA